MFTYNLTIYILEKIGMKGNTYRKIHRSLSQSEESKYMWTYGKDGVMWVFEKCHQRGCKTWSGGNGGKGK